jgi:hypothetical protein
MRAKYFLITKNHIVLMLTLLFLISCNKFLDVRYSKGTTALITTTSDLDVLLNTFTDFCAENDNVAIYGTDDNGLSASLYAAKPSVFTGTNMGPVMFSLWDKDNLAGVDVSGSTKSFWATEYSKILRANLVLSNVDAVTGTAADKDALRADAHFIRAYSYWELANTYCLPYTEANKNELGLPLKTQPNYTENVARQSLEATYQLIEADLTEALKTTVPLVQKGVARHWRANTAAVNGFAARYWLNKNDYAKALQYANTALTEYSTLVDYKTGMSYGTPASVTVNGQSLSLVFPYTHNKSTYEDMLGWKEFLYFRMLNNTLLWYIPSQDLLNLYDKNNDLRYKYHYVQNYSYKRGLISPATPYPGYVFFYEDRMPSGPTVAEMILIKAECQARIGAGDINGAMATLNLLYSKRTLAGTAPLTASTQAQAITVVLQERRREMPFSARWFDIRRFNNNDYAGDDVGDLTRNFYPYTTTAVTTTSPTQDYTLTKNSRRWASPIPQTDITNSNGVIVQNTY